MMGAKRDDLAGAGALQAQAHDWAARLASGNATRQDGESFRRWRAQSPAHEQAWKHAAQTWRELGGVTRAYAAHAPAVARPARPTRRQVLGLAATAAGAVGAVGLVRPPLGLWEPWRDLDADYRTATGERRDLDVVAQASVMLNTQSSLSVDMAGDAPRLALLRGEAAVTARRAAPLDVVAGAGRVRLTHGDIELRCLRDGAVRLRCNAGGAELCHGERVLQVPARHEVAYDARQLGVLRPYPSAGAQADWRRGMLVFHDLPLAEAIEEINRYRPGRVVLLDESQAARRISANFEIAALDEAVAQIQSLYHLPMRRMGRVVFLG